MSDTGDERQLLDAIQMAAAGIRSRAKDRLERIALLCVQLRSRARDLPASYVEYVTAILDALEDEVARQVDGAVVVGRSEIDTVVGEAAKLVAGHRASLVASVEAQRDVSATREALRLAQIRITELEGQLRRLAEHRQHNEGIRERVWAATGGKCLYCSVDLVKEQGLPNSFEVDHLVPKNAGGPDHLANFVPSCAKCNGEKSDRPFLEFVMNERKRAVLRVVGGSEITTVSFPWETLDLRHSSFVVDRELMVLRIATLTASWPTALRM